MSILYTDNYTLQKNKIIQQKLLESDLQHELWLKSRLHKSQIYKKKISSGLAVVLLKFSGVISLTHVISPSLELRMDVKRFKLYSPLEVKVNSMAR